MPPLRAVKVALACLLTALLTASGTEAAGGAVQGATAPTLASVGQQNRHPTATFAPLPGVDGALIYVATKPDRASDGSFLDENIKTSDSLTDDEIARGSWLYESQLDPGLYYVMARTFDFDCYQNPNCIEGFSNMLTLTIPKPAQRYGAKVELLRYIRIAYLTFTVRPLGEKLPYKVCWTLTRGTRCVHATVDGYSWNDSASDMRRISMRKMRKVTTFSWYVNGQRVAVKRLRIRR
jgi:hypothetical protein